MVVDAESWKLKNYNAGQHSPCILLEDMPFVPCFDWQQSKSSCNHLCQDVEGFTFQSISESKRRGHKKSPWIDAPNSEYIWIVWNKLFGNGSAVATHRWRVSWQGGWWDVGQDDISKQPQIVKQNYFIHRAGLIVAMSIFWSESFSSTCNQNTWIKSFWLLQKKGPLQ